MYALNITDAFLLPYMECFSMRTQVSEEMLDLTHFKEKPNAHDTHDVMLWYKELGLHAFKYPLLHRWQVELSMNIHFNCQDVFGIIATGANLYKEVKNGLYHMVVVVPEQYNSKSFKAVLDDEAFRQLLV